MTSVVTASVRPKGAGTALVVTHTPSGGGAKWAKAVKEAQKGWETGLENLQSVLETGQDLRLTLRPMLGILIGEKSCWNQGYGTEALIQQLALPDGGRSAQQIVRVQSAFVVGKLSSCLR